VEERGLVELEFIEVLIYTLTISFADIVGIVLDAHPEYSV